MESVILPGEACRVAVGPSHPQSDIDFGPDFTIVEEGLGFSNSAGVLELKSKKERKLLNTRHTTMVYFPKEADTVIGIIVKKNAENYGVDISTAL
jgi:exosome complex RNA-binding protein Rrp4